VATALCVTTSHAVTTVPGVSAIGYASFMTPSVRGSVARGGLEQSLLAMGPSAGERFRRKLPLDTLSAVEGASAFGWVPLRHHMVVLQAVRSELGDVAFRQLARDGSSKMLDESAFRTLIEAAFRMIGVSPRSLLRMASKGWDVAFRLCGTLIHREQGADGSDVVLLSFPGSGREAETFALGLAGTFDALVKMAGRSGSVQYDAHDPTRIEFAVRWTEASRTTEASSSRIL